MAGSVAGGPYRGLTCAPEGIGDRRSPIGLVRSSSSSVRSTDERSTARAVDRGCLGHSPVWARDRGWWCRRRMHHRDDDGFVIPGHRRADLAPADGWRERSRGTARGPSLDGFLTPDRTPRLDAPSRYMGALGRARCRLTQGPGQIVGRGVEPPHHHDPQHRCYRETDLGHAQLARHLLEPVAEPADGIHRSPAPAARPGRD